MPRSSMPSWYAQPAQANPRWLGTERTRTARLWNRPAHCDRPVTSGHRRTPHSVPPVACEPTQAYLLRLQVPSSAMLHAAGSRALIAQSREKLVTRSLHAELVYNLSGSKHITDALRRWGVATDVTAVLVAVFDASAADLQTLRVLVQGVEVGAAGSIEEAVGGLVDLAATKKARTRRQRSLLSAYVVLCISGPYDPPLISIPTGRRPSGRALTQPCHLCAGRLTRFSPRNWKLVRSRMLSSHVWP